MRPFVLTMPVEDAIAALTPLGAWAPAPAIAAAIKSSEHTIRTWKQRGLVRSKEVDSPLSHPGRGSAPHLLVSVRDVAARLQIPTCYGKHLLNTEHKCPPEGVCTGCLAISFLQAKAINWATTTFDNKLLHVTYFARCCPAMPDSPEPIEQFLGGLRYAQQYKHNIWRTTSQLYSWAERRGRIDFNPCGRVESPKRPAPEPYWLEEEELEQLLMHPAHSPRDRAILFLLGGTGMRIGEAASITGKNLYDGHAIVFGKTGRRVVVIQPRIIQMIRECIPSYAKPEQTVWWSNRGPMSRTGLMYAVRTAFRRAGFNGAKMSPHRLRHAFATLWTGSDADAMDIGGWKHYEMYRIYRTLRTRRLSEELEQHSPLARLLKAPDRPFTPADATRLEDLKAVTS